MPQQREQGRFVKWRHSLQSLTDEMVTETPLRCASPSQIGGTCNMQHAELTLNQSQWFVGSKLQPAARVKQQRGCLAPTKPFLTT